MGWYWEGVCVVGLGHALGSDRNYSARGGLTEDNQGCVGFALPRCLVYVSVICIHIRTLTKLAWWLRVLLGSQKLHSTLLSGYLGVVVWVCEFGQPG